MKILLEYWPWLYLQNMTGMDVYLDESPHVWWHIWIVYRMRASKKWQQRKRNQHYFAWIFFSLVTYKDFWNWVWFLFEKKYMYIIFTLTFLWANFSLTSDFQICSQEKMEEKILKMKLIPSCGILRFLSSSICASQVWGWKVKVASGQTHYITSVRRMTGAHTLSHQIQHPPPAWILK